MGAFSAFMLNLSGLGQGPAAPSPGAQRRPRQSPECAPSKGGGTWEFLLPRIEKNTPCCILVSCRIDIPAPVTFHEHARRELRGIGIEKIVEIHQFMVVCIPAKSFRKRRTEPRSQRWRCRKFSRNSWRWIRTRFGFKQKSFRERLQAPRRRVEASATRLCLCRDFSARCCVPRCEKACETTAELLVKTSYIYVIEPVTSAMPTEESVVYSEVSVAVEQQLGVHCEDVEQAIET